MGLTADMAAFGKPLTVIVTLAVPVHPFAAVTVTL